MKDGEPSLGSFQDEGVFGCGDEFEDGIIGENKFREVLEQFRGGMRCFQFQGVCGKFKNNFVDESEFRSSLEMIRGSRESNL